MSLLPYAPHHYGLILRQQPETGLLVSPPWAGDGVLSVSVSTPAEVAMHALQSGESGPTDAILLRPQEISFTIRCSNTVSPRTLAQHPRPDFVGVDRAVKMVDELREIVRERNPVTIVLRGNAPFRNYGLAGIQVDWPLDRAEAVVTLTARALRIVTLGVAEVTQDADLIAVGSQEVQIGILTSPA